MEHVELIQFGLLVGVAALVALAGVLRVPYPILLGTAPLLRARGRERQAPAYGEHSAAVARRQRELLAAERAALLDLRNTGAISDDVRRRVERELDLEESRLGG